jgi:O-Antigen ligase
MESYFGWLYFKLISIVIVGVLLSRYVPNNLRLRLFPFCFAGLLAVSIASPFLSQKFSYGVMGSIYILNAFLLFFDFSKSFKLNSVEKCFFVFYAYHLLVNVYAPYAELGFHAKIMALISYFFAGIMAGIYCARNDQLSRLSRWVAFFALIILLVYDRNVISETNLDEGERLGVTDVLNSNLAGLHLVCLMPFLTLTTFSLSEKVVNRFVAGFAWVGCSTLLFLTGSRNAFLGGLVAFFGTILLVSKNRLITFVSAIGGIGLAGYVLSTMVFVKESRLFDFTDTSGSGRTDAWIRWLENRTFIQKVFGAGTFYDFDNGDPRWANMHSIYVQMLYEIGYFGLALFVVYLLVHIRCALRMGVQGRVSLILLATCLACGVGETYPYASGSLLTLLWGLSIGLLSYRQQLMPKVFPHNMQFIR